MARVSHQVYSLDRHSSIDDGEDVVVDTPTNFSAAAPHHVKF